MTLALPASALGAPASIEQKLTTPESGVVEYSVNCGTQAAPLDTVPATGSIDYAITPGTAAKDVDYKDVTAGATGNTIMCTAAGPVPAKIRVEIQADTADELNETFTVTLSNPTLTVQPPNPASVTTTITDDDVPVASIEPLVQVVEGDSGTTDAAIKVNLDQPTANQVTVPYTLTDYNTQGAADYQGTGGQITIQAGSKQGTITIPIVGDTTYEQVEGFFVTLGTPTNAALDNKKSQGIVAIFDNEQKPVGGFSLGDNQTVREGNDAPVNMVFTVTLEPGLDEPVQVAWKTANWTAKLNDYQGGQGILRFEPGETQKTISINIKPDRRKEPTEVFGVLLEGPVGATIVKGAALGIIEDDDSDGAPVPTGGPKVGLSSPSMDGATLSLLVKCPDAATSCNGILGAASGKLKVGKSRFELAQGAETDLRVKLSKAARKALRRRSLRVKLVAVTRDANGAVGVTTKTIRIKRRKPKLKIGSVAVDRRELAAIVACKGRGRCKGVLRVRARGMKVAQRRFKLASGQKSQVVAKLSRKARRKLRRGSLRVKVTAVAKNRIGARTKTTRKLRLRL